MSNETVAEFWGAYLTTLPEHHPHRFHPLPAAWSFGEGEEMADKLADLVLRGIKTATRSRYLSGNILDDAGLSILLDGAGRPLCLVETYEITVRRFREVDADFAAAEGENDLSLGGWRQAHWTFFSREAVKEGYEVGEDMLLSCERFRVLYRPER